MSTNQHVGTATKLARRRRVTPSEATQWLRAAEAGDSLATIATRAGVDVRTARQHVERARAEQELAAVRLTMLQVAADRHQQELLDVAAALEATLDPALHSLHFALEQTPGEIRLAGKRYRGLLKHTHGSGLPHALSQWEASAKRYAAAMDALRGELTREVAATDLDPAGTVTEMLGRLAKCPSYGAVPPDEPPWHVHGGDLNKGSSRIRATVTSLDEPRVIDAQRAYAALWTTITTPSAITTAPAITELCSLQSKEEIRERVRDLLEDLRLRHYLGPATCSWCPGSTESRRKGGR